MAKVDLLSLQKNVISRDLRGKYILLAGAPKIGKTEFCCESEDALILATEIGTNAQTNACVQPIESWSDIINALRQLDNQMVKEKFKTVCIDTVGIMFDLAEQFVCVQNGVSKINDIPYGGGYTQRDKAFENALRKITMMGYGLIMTCHLKEIYDEEGKLISAKPDLNNRCLKIVNGLVDVISVITQTWNEKGESERWVQTRSTPTIAAGSRYKYLAPRIPFGFKEFEAALAKAIDMAEERGAVVVDKKPIFETQKLDYLSIMNECRKIWTEKVESAATEEEKANVVRAMSKKVEMIFGHPTKLSEVLEEQVDLLNLVLQDLTEMQ